MSTITRQVLQPCRAPTVASVVRSQQRSKEPRTRLRRTTITQVITSYIEAPCLIYRAVRWDGVLAYRSKRSAIRTPIVGGTGMFGHHVADLLASNGHEVTIGTRRQPRPSRRIRCCSVITPPASSLRPTWNRSTRSCSLDSDTATATSTLVRIDLLDDRPVLHSFGSYADRLVRCGDGMWRFVRRVPMPEAFNPDLGIVL
ncbi:NAD-dependent epimerase/dehydratase family protein [Nocardioides sp. NPDC051685]|uniref:NAD-dependent epimerase/dehydratase family protein n=1 Tax=Nocardioides sp. NPDC051685 TaxID=3364334 RepID=UPI0037B3F91F